MTPDEIDALEARIAALTAETTAAGIVFPDHIRAMAQEIVDAGNELQSVIDDWEP